MCTNAETRVDTIREVIQNRRSIRKGWLDTTIVQDILLDIVNAGIAAPSGGNVQATRFIIITNKNIIAQLATDRGFPKGPTAVILTFTDRALCMTKPVWQLLPIQDAAAAMQNMLIMATAYGLATCWWSALPTMDNTVYLHKKTWKQVLEKFNLPDTYEIQGIVLLGRVNIEDMYGDLTHHGRAVKRKDVKEYIHEIA
jgi:nitroreductase